MAQDGRNEYTARLDSPPITTILSASTTAAGSARPCGKRAASETRPVVRIDPLHSRERDARTVLPPMM